MNEELIASLQNGSFFQLSYNVDPLQKMLIEMTEIIQAQQKKIDQLSSQIEDRPTFVYMTSFNEEINNRFDRVVRKVDNATKELFETLDQKVKDIDIHIAEIVPTKEEFVKISTSCTKEVLTIFKENEFEEVKDSIRKTRSQINQSVENSLNTLKDRIYRIEQDTRQNHNDFKKLREQTDLTASTASIDTNPNAPNADQPTPTTSPLPPRGGTPIRARQLSRDVSNSSVSLNYAKEEDITAIIEKLSQNEEKIEAYHTDLNEKVKDLVAQVKSKPDRQFIERLFDEFKKTLLNVVDALDEIRDRQKQFLTFDDVAHLDES